MANYYVSYDRDRKLWKAERDGAKHAAEDYKTQREAIKRARELTANSGGGEIQVHRKDNGKIRENIKVEKKK